MKKIHENEEEKMGQTLAEKQPDHNEDKHEQTPDQKKIEAMRKVLIFLRDDCVSGSASLVDMINGVV